MSFGGQLDPFHVDECMRDLDKPAIKKLTAKLDEVIRLPARWAYTRDQCATAANGAAAIMSDADVKIMDAFHKAPRYDVKDRASTQGPEMRFTTLMDATGALDTKASRLTTVRPSSGVMAQLAGS